MISKPEPEPEFVESDISFDSVKVNIAPIEQVDSDPEQKEQNETGEAPEQNGTPPVSTDQTEEDLMLLSVSLWSMPSLIFKKLEPLSEEQIKGWNRQFYLYCQKKGIDPFDYLFDELGILMSTLTLGIGMYHDYQDKYPKHKKEPENMTSEEKIKSGTADFDHAKQIEKEAEEKDNG